MMQNWTDGYLADIDYTYGYNGEMNPQRLALAFAQAGVVMPNVGTACELGFGQGLSTNIHAAASTVSWYGTDFNPAQASFARELAQSAGHQAQLFDQSFKEFCSRDDLPEFDFIALHGIWSWVSAENRTILVDFFRRKLKVGGVLYISYNTLPGWSAFAPIRQLMTEHALSMGSSGAGVVERINGALDFVDRVFSVDPLHLRVNPTANDRLTIVKNQNRHYLAHEYFNADWHPMYFSELAQLLNSAKLDFASSANLLDLVDAINLSEPQQKLLSSIPDLQLRQTVRDFVVNQQFRRDYWVKGLRRLSGLEQLEAFRSLKLVLTTRREDVKLQSATALGRINLHEPIYAPVLDVLADNRPHGFEEIEQKVASRGVTTAQLRDAVVVLAGIGALEVAGKDADHPHTRKACAGLNARLFDKARSSSEINFVASPVIAGGIALARFHQMFVQSLQRGHKKPEEWAQETWRVLAAQGQTLVKDGKSLASADENLAELTEMAKSFAEKLLPVLKALQIA